jgi:hypothetical protein
MKPLTELTAPEALRERFDLEADFGSTHSPTGMQLESIATRILGPGHNGGRADSQEAKRLRLMDLLKLTAGLSEKEVDVARLRYRMLAQPTGYEKLRRPADIREGDGETIIENHPVDDKGVPIGGFVRVVGSKTRQATNRELAAHTGMSGYQVGLLGTAALHKTGEALKRLREKGDDAAL